MRGRVACAALSVLLTSARAADISMGSGMGIVLHVASLKEMSERHVVRQRHDYSCGAASLATLLTEQLADPVTEDEIIRQTLGLLAEGDMVDREKTGLSLLDLKRVAQQRGHRAAGYRLGIDQLPKIDRAVIVFLNIRDEPHFSVLRGIRGDRAFLSDPTQGNMRMPLERFREYWLGKKKQGIIFVVERADGRIDLDWRALPGADFEAPEKLEARMLMNIGTAYPGAVR
ncbi:MAG: C39 family peptidase [Burkholderiales bacterium]|nr:C39 family peptidase [Burkholderiales bacterium]